MNNLSRRMLGTLLIVAFESKAAIPLHLQQTSWSDVQKQFYVQWPGMQLSSMFVPQALHFVKQRTDEKQVSHVHFQQTYQGFNVFGGYAILHTRVLPVAVSATRLSGVLYQDLSAELGMPPPFFKQRAVVALKRFTAALPAYFDEEVVVPIVYIDEQSEAHFAYHVSAQVIYPFQMPEKPHAIVDANTLKMLVAWNDIKTARKLVQGQGYGGNVSMGKYFYGHDFPWLSMSRDDFRGMCYLENRHVSVVNMRHSYQATNRPFEFDCAEEAAVYWTGDEQDGYDRANGAYSPSNDALFVGQMVDAMYQQWYGVNVLSLYRPPLQIRVHYGQQVENAFWDGYRMTFGDGGPNMYPLVSLGIGAHEISHGFTEQHANLVYVGQSGGINESFSDMAAQAVDYFVKGENSWEIGAEIMKQHGKHRVLRYMEHPADDGHSIERVSQYHTGLDVHYLSGIYNRLFYVLAHQPGWDTRQAFHVMLKANMDYWTPYTTFQSGGCGVLDAASDLGYSVDDVQQALSSVEIDGFECFR